MFADDFGPFEGRVWLNAAHQGPLPRVAVEAAERAIELKVAPHRIADEAFVEVPLRQRRLLAATIGADERDVILGNSASYGLQLLANGLPWRRGDEVIVLANEFPATIFPWLVCERRGVTVRRLRPDRPVLAPEELAAALSRRTRVVALNWVRSLTGHVADLQALGEICRAADVHLVANVTQGLGALRLDVRETPLAAISCSGFKWLCGPYATGFAWISPDVLATMEPAQAYWLAMPDGVTLDLDREGDVTLRNDLGARAYDVFGTANFLDVLPWSAAVAYLLDCGLDAVASHDQTLVQQLIDGLDERGFRFVSPTERRERAAIVVVTAGDEHRNAELHGRLRAEGIDVALRAGNLRFSPHVYNTAEEIERTLAALP
jgi:selenocysteine lyase/cysteine desulfurase